MAKKTDHRIAIALGNTGSTHQRAWVINIATLYSFLLNFDTCVPILIHLSDERVRVLLSSRTIDRRTRESSQHSQLATAQQQHYNNTTPKLPVLLYYSWTNEITMAKRNVGYLRRSGKNRPLMETVYNHRAVPVGDGLDLDHINLVLTEAIPQFSSDSDLVQMARMKARYLTEALPDEKNGKALSDDDLEDVAMILEDFLSSTESLPSSVVAYVHTYIGLVRQYQERYSSAIVSLLKALWIRKASHEGVDRLAVSCHRLGLVYGLAGDFEQATSLLERAIRYYDDAHVGKDHHFVVGAKKSLEVFAYKISTSSHRRELREEHESVSTLEPKIRRISAGDVELI